MYFEKGGEDNTAKVLEISLARFEKGDIDTVVIASTLWTTAKLAADVFSDTNVHS